MFFNYILKKQNNKITNYILKRLYIPLLFIFCYILPTFIPLYFWNEEFWNAFFVCVIIRAIFVAHVTFSVNSFAHMFGSSKYDVNIKARQNFLVTMFTNGEGFHNYHHTFPRDYAACEFSNYRRNRTTQFIDLMAFFGQAYDRIKVDPETICKRRTRTGDWSLKKLPDANADHNLEQLDIAQQDF